jgi:hypothetical protein
MAITGEKDVIPNLVVIHVLQRSVAVRDVSLLVVSTRNLYLLTFQIALTFQLSPLRAPAAFWNNLEKMIWLPMMRQVAPLCEDLVGWL